MRELLPKALGFNTLIQCFRFKKKNIYLSLWKQISNKIPSSSPLLRLSVDQFIFPGTSQKQLLCYLICFWSPRQCFKSKWSWHQCLVEKLHFMAVVSACEAAAAAAGHSSQGLCWSHPSSPWRFMLQLALPWSEKEELRLERGLAQHFLQFILYQEHWTNKTQLSIRCYLRCRTYRLGNSCGTLAVWKWIWLLIGCLFPSSLPGATLH